MVGILIGLQLVQSFILLISWDVHMCSLGDFHFDVDIGDLVRYIYRMISHDWVIVVVLVNFTALDRGKLSAEGVDVHDEDSVVHLEVILFYPNLIIHRFRHILPVASPLSISPRIPQLNQLLIMLLIVRNTQNSIGMTRHDSKLINIICSWTRCRCR
jgi:hypothetical protein